jgi:hypothetical protein
MAKVIEREHLGTTEAAPGAEEVRHRKPIRWALPIIGALAILAVMAAVTGYLLSRGGEESAAITVDFDVSSSYVPDPSRELEGVSEGSKGPVSFYVPTDPAREIEMALTKAQRASSYVPPADELGMALREESVAPVDDLRFR